MILIFLLSFSFITFYRLRLGLFFLFLLLPTYLIRFSIGSLPTTLLEMMVVIVILIFSIKYLVLSDKSLILNLKSLILNHKSFFLASTIFLLAATISIFTSTNTRTALGEWKAFYIEPFLLFLVLISTIKNEQKTTNKKPLILNTKYLILIALVLCGLATSTLAIYQHFTGWLVPWDFWQNNATFRVTAWYGFPNAVGLFLAPLVPLAIYSIQQGWNTIKILKETRNKFQDTKKIQNSKFKIQNDSKNFNLVYFLISWCLFLVSLFFIPLSFLAIIFAKSTGALVGLTAGLGLLLLFNKKTRLPAIVIAIIGFLTLTLCPQLSTIKNEVLLQDRSGQIRLSIWRETTRFLIDHPIAGAGLASYAQKIAPYHTTVNGEGIEIFHHPHNIFLTMWVNLGLLGLVGFVCLLISILNIEYSIFKKEKKLPLMNYFLIASVATILITGLVDSPYIKNDLAILFWCLIALTIIGQSGNINNHTITTEN